MMKGMIMGALVAGLLACAFAEPWEGKGPPDPARMAELHRQHWQKLHEKLCLKPEQEAAWQVFVERSQPVPPPPPPDPAEREQMMQLKTPQRVERILERMRAHHAKMEENLAAVQEFYAKLSPEQQEVMDQEPLPPPPRPPGNRRPDAGDRPPGD
ncbi:Spy/CpxP family protein refolding chaperone [bacterium]|nr:Spy/CpxP family protein refolding chaperone [bacterium]